MCRWPRLSQTRAGLYLAELLFHSASCFSFLLRTRLSPRPSNQHTPFAFISSKFAQEVWFLLVFISSSSDLISRSSLGSQQHNWQATHPHLPFHRTLFQSTCTLPSSCSTQRAHFLSSCLLPLFHALTRAAPRRRPLPKHFHQSPPRMLTLTLSRHFSPTSSDTQIFQTQIRCPQQSKLKFTSAANNSTASGRQAPNTHHFAITILALLGQHTNSQFHTDS